MDFHKKWQKSRQKKKQDDGSRSTMHKKFDFSPLDGITDLKTWWSLHKNQDLKEITKGIISKKIESSENEGFILYWKNELKKLQHTKNR